MMFGLSAFSWVYKSQESAEDSGELINTFTEAQGAATKAFQKMLTKRGYSLSLLKNEKAKKTLMKALADGGKLISSCTGKLWIDRPIPEIPPAFVDSGMLKVGDFVQLVKWYSVDPDLSDECPMGRVTKIYPMKCVVTKERSSALRMVEKTDMMCTEDRVQGLELDGRGPFGEKTTETPFPYLVKDDTLIIRFPEYATPSGETVHVEPSFM